MLLKMIRYYLELKIKIKKKIFTIAISLPIKHKIGRYLRQRRKGAGFTIEEASFRSGVAQQTIKATEKSLYSIPLCDMTALIEIYGVDKFDYTMFVNQLGFTIYRRRKAIESFFGKGK